MELHDVELAFSNMIVAGHTKLHHVLVIDGARRIEVVDLDKTTLPVFFEIMVANGYKSVNNFGDLPIFEK